MMQSEQIEKLAAALSKAQSEVEGAIKDSENPHFRSKYADLSSVITAMREPFTKNQLAYYQHMRAMEGEMRLVTRILHSSGQWIEDDGVPLLLDKQNMQGLGSATTYARRYGLMAAAGIAPEDDDGNAAVNNAAPAGKTVEAKASRGPAKQEPAKNGGRKIAVSWPDGKTREFPATKGGGIEAMSAIEAACAVNAGSWDINKETAQHLAEVIPELQQRYDILEHNMEQEEEDLPEPLNNMAAG